MRLVWDGNSYHARLRTPHPGSFPWGGGPGNTGYPAPLRSHGIKLRDARQETSETLRAMGRDRWSRRPAGGVRHSRDRRKRRRWTVLLANRAGHRRRPWMGRRHRDRGFLAAQSQRRGITHRCSGPAGAVSCSSLPGRAPAADRPYVIRLNARSPDLARPPIPEREAVLGGH